MSYAQSVLQPGETIVAIGRLHWIIYWLGDPLAGPSAWLMVWL